MADEESNERAIAELRTAVLQVVVAVNEIDAALIQFAQDLRFGIRRAPIGIRAGGNGIVLQGHEIDRLDSRLRDAQVRLRAAVDVLVKEEGIENG